MSSFQCNCGAQVFSDQSFCPHCGAKLGVSNLSQVPDAIRSAVNRTSPKDQEKKYGQQEWRLFETNYQRNKGISLDESLQEIENASKYGVPVRTGGGAAGAAGSTSSSSTSFGAGGGGGAGFGAGGAGGGGASFGPGGAGGAGGVGFGRSGGAGAGTGKFDERTDAGAAFFNQHQVKEAAKYKPGYRGE
ncbi:Immunoglobulin like and fibronectin type III domain containing 1, tandem duplicate 1 [Balamuthia mandrillaris]